MKRANFPGRKNRKRIEALARLVDRVDNRIPTFAQANELRVLERRIVPQAQALNTFTKKWRATGLPPASSRAS